MNDTVQYVHQDVQEVLVLLVVVQHVVVVAIYDYHYDVAYLQDLMVHSVELVQWISWCSQRMGMLVSYGIVWRRVHYLCILHF